MAATRKMQGDLRPLGRKSPSPRAIVRHAEIAPLVDPLGLPLAVALTLKQEVQRAMCVYLAPTVIAEGKVDHATSLRQLSSIRSASITLADKLQHLHPDLLLALDETWSAKTAHIPLFHLIPELRRLAGCVEAASATAKRRPIGPTRKTNLDTAVAHVLPVIEQAGLEVLLGESGSKVRRKSVTGKGGELILAIFQKFGRQTGIPELHGSIKRVRSTS